MTLLEAAALLQPGTAWNLNGDTLVQAEDGSPRVVVPTLEELNAYIDARAYREKRAKEYPVIGDQLDALWKGGQAAEDMHNQVLAVKSKYPKPS